MGLLRMAQVPPLIVKPDVTVMDAVVLMARDKVGAVSVVESIELLGIFTERDLMLRVVKEGRDPMTTRVRDVMTPDVKTITETSTEEEAIGVMLNGHLRHLPILGNDGSVLGVLSIRSLLEDRLEDLTHEVSSLEQYLANDGPGG